MKPVQRWEDTSATRYAREMDDLAPFIARYPDERLLEFFSFNTLRERVGERVIQVTRSLNSDEDAEIAMTSYLDYIQSEVGDAAAPDSPRPWYLLRARNRDLVRGVRREWLPEFFRFNVLNALPEDSDSTPVYTKDWLFLGPEGSVSELHFDHHFVHTILVQCEGAKRLRLVDNLDWRLIEAGARENCSGWDGLDPVPEHLEAKAYECVLEKGDFIFIPAGWYHGVLNLSASSTYSHDFVDPVNFTRWLPEALADDVYRDFFIKARED